MLYWRFASCRRQPGQIEISLISMRFFFIKSKQVAVASACKPRRRTSQGSTTPPVVRMKAKARAVLVRRCAASTSKSSSSSLCQSSPSSLPKYEAPSSVAAASDQAEMLRRLLGEGARNTGKYRVK